MSAISSSGRARLTRGPSPADLAGRERLAAPAGDRRGARAVHRNGQVVGLTGSPGVGKSTSTAVMVSALRKDGKRVGVLAVDPSSPFSVWRAARRPRRMQTTPPTTGCSSARWRRADNPRRIVGRRPAGAARARRGRCDVILVETVGVGQAEVEIASLADTTVVLLAPGMGDGIQAAKAGILEIADIFVVNKADRDGADQVTRDLRYMQSLGGRHSAAGAWRAPIREDSRVHRRRHAGRTCRAGQAS